jgi:quercetin dioxygenase-like cupin family protein
MSMSDDLTVSRTYQWDDMPKSSAVDPRATVSKINGHGTTILRGEIKAGFKMPRHDHPQEQITMVMSGRLHVWSESEEQGTVLGPGGVARVPGGMPHGAEALEDVVLFDVFAPARP